MPPVNSSLPESPPPESPSPSPPESPSPESSPGDSAESRAPAESTAPADSAAPAKSPKLRDHKPGPKPRTKKPRGVEVDGMLLLDKPAGLTSNQALQIAKRLLNARKAGHTGSLDPIATGLLPLCFGETTRVAELFLGAGKRYWVRIKFGVDTDTGDREGKTLREAKAAFSEKELHAALDKFRGRFKQVPPMFSALKRDGRPLYKLARKGISVEREAREVTVYDLRVQQRSGDELDLDIACSRGFYLRALARDLGEALGCGAHVSALRRTAVGDFSVEDAVGIAQMEKLDTPAARRKFLLPTERAVAHLPEVSVPDNIAFHLSRGRPVRVAGTAVAAGAAGAATGESAGAAESGAAAAEPSAKPAGAATGKSDGESAGAAAAEPAAPKDGVVRVVSPGGGFLGLADLADGKITPKR
ncbi:MAG: tRNA pseudouridine(55) synthase TruB, partial [Gammaproteobacteria bacterium]|nr:tRNA pseudouridine(55) synthase TruB [Gammaproteobacteria bacterium]